MELQITGFAFGGRAIGRLDDGRLCFVRGGAPGDIAEIRLVKEKKNYVEAKLCGVKIPSEKRTCPPCPLAASPGNCCSIYCPGCSYQHVSYETEMEWKQRQFEGFAYRSGWLSADRMASARPAPARFGWRNKIKLAVENTRDGIKTGYRAEDNTTLVPVDWCPIAHPSINEAIKGDMFRNAVASETTSLTMRYTDTDGVIFMTDSDADRTGRRLTESLGHHGEFKVSASSFFQINPIVASDIADTVTSYLRKIGPKHVTDLYCGVGVFSVIAAKALPEASVRGVEIDRNAVDTANLNAAMHGVDSRCRFSAGDAGRLYRNISNGTKASDSLLIVDPPRTGIDRECLHAIAQSAVVHIIYISCAADTLNRDILMLRQAGYEAVESGIYDMFPSTAHFESLTLLRHAGKV